MKPEWLSRLLGPETAVADAPDEPWASLLQPLDDHQPCGEDVAGSDVFFEVREQLSLLSGLDAEKLRDDCSRLLASEGKDLRPAVYLVYAALRLDGWQGFAEGLDFLGRLLARYGEGLHPARPEARKATLDWLAGTRVLDWLSTLDAPEPAQRDAIGQALTRLTALTEGWPAPARPALGALASRFQQGETPSPEPAPPPVAASGSPRDIQSSQALMESVRGMAAYLRQQPHGAFAAYRLVRVVRWDSVAAPPPHDGQWQTRLAAPRPELRQQLRRLLLQKQWHGLLEKIEPAFLEGANHFWLDLQYFAWEALGQLGEDYQAWRESALTDVAQMRERLAGIEQLRFNDGTPFADDKTLEWLASHAVVLDIAAGESVNVAPALSRVSGEMAQVREEAFALAESQGLEHALGWLQSLPHAAGQREQAERLFLMAGLAESRSRADIALGVLHGLDQQVSQAAISAWDPAFAFEVKAAYQRLLRLKQGRKDADKSGAQQDLLQRLHHELSLLDPLRVLLLPAH